MKKFLILIIFLSGLTAISHANESVNKDIVIKNRLFSITIPNDMRGSFEAKTTKDRISIFHKESQKAGFGGFAFGIKAYKNPADHAELPGGKKIGELTDKNDFLYDIVLKYPTDVQYDYTKNTDAPDSYKKLYDYGKNVKINGTGDLIYCKNQGMKGEDLYQNILKKHITAINEKWDSTKLEKEDMSYMYNVINSSGENALDKIGYIFYDTNADGIDELLIGEIAQGEWKGVIYDMYTMVNRKPKHVVSGGSRNRYFVCDNVFICNEYSSGAKESGVRTYILVENSTELFPQVSFKYDGYQNSKKPWFISYSDNIWENVSEEYFNERKKVFDKYERFNFIPLRKALKNTQKLEERYNTQKDYFDYSAVLKEFPKDYYYTTVKINKSKERILIITDKKTNTNFYYLLYYIANNGFVYPLGLIESKTPLAQSKSYLYLNNGNEDIRFYLSDKKFSIIKTRVEKINEKINNIEFVTIESADKFAGDFGEPAGDDVVKASLDGFYFEYHRPQYKRKYIKNLMKECIKDGVKTQVQMYCCMVKKLHE